MNKTEMFQPYYVADVFVFMRDSFEFSYELILNSAFFFLINSDLQPEKTSNITIIEYIYPSQFCTGFVLYLPLYF